MVEAKTVLLALALAAATIQVLKETYSVLTSDGKCKKTGTRIARTFASLGSIVAAAGAGAIVLTRPNQWTEIQKLSSTTRLLASILFVTELTIFGFGIVAEAREEYYKRYQEGAVFGWQFEALMAALISAAMVTLSVLTIITKWSPKFLYVWDLVVYGLLAVTYALAALGLIYRSVWFERLALTFSLAANGVVVGLAGWSAGQGGGFDEEKYARILGISILASVSEELVLLAKMRRVRGKGEKEEEYPNKSYGAEPVAVEEVADVIIQ